MKIGSIIRKKVLKYYFLSFKFKVQLRGRFCRPSVGRRRLYGIKFSMHLKMSTPLFVVHEKSTHFAYIYGLAPRNFRAAMPSQTSPEVSTTTQHFFFFKSCFQMACWQKVKNLGSRFRSGTSAVADRPIRVVTSLNPGQESHMINLTSSSSR